MTDLPKYTALEIERRWLVDLHAVGDIESTPFRSIDDLYVANSRLRLRRITDQNGESIFKLGKKYGKRSTRVEPVSTLYLSEAEYLELATLPGFAISKSRYSVAGGSLDVFHPPILDLAIFEIEFETERLAERYQPPTFATQEVTGSAAYSCWSLAKNGGLTRR